MRSQNSLTAILLQARVEQAEMVIGVADEGAGISTELLPRIFEKFTRGNAHAGKVLTHRQLLREVWGANYVEQTHYLRVYMAHLREKLEANPSQPELLITEPGVGYRLMTKE